MIAVECKAWAENIEHDRTERRGIAHFEVKTQHCFGQNISFIFSADDRLRIFASLVGPQIFKRKI